MLAFGACGDDGGGGGGPTGSGTIAGQVVVSGPLRGATISVDQIDLDDPDGNIRAHVADATTDAEGRFTVETGQFNGLFVVTASGGSFTDLANDAMIQLDATDELKSLAYLDLFEVRDDVLVSPVGHLIEARMRAKLATYANVADAHEDAADHLTKHFGNVDWTRLKLGSLATPASSPTESVRSALVQAALSYLTQDIALAAGASPQEVNVFTLTQALSADLGEGTFDGNDGNTMIAGGLQVGVCGPVEGCVVPGAGGVVGACRPFCDLYAGTPRALLAGAMAKVSSLPINQTGLGTADILAVARSINDNVDEDLFASCIENLDRSPPSLAWETPTPADGTYVKGAVTLRVKAYDDTDNNPMVVLEGHDDTDASNPTAQATIDTSSVTDGPLVVVATATDMANNKKTEQRSVVVDNTAPSLTLTLPSTGYFVDGTTWWTSEATPTLTGTIADVAPASIKAVVDGVDYPGTISGATWSVMLPAGVIALDSVQITIIATDLAGNTGQLLQSLRYDATPPSVTLPGSSVINEIVETVTFTSSTAPGSDGRPRHAHIGSSVPLDVPGCPAFTKFSYLLGPSTPPYTLEVDGGGLTLRNPIQYNPLVTDDGVGIQASSTQYRVGRRDPGGTTWITNWTSMGTGSPFGAGSNQYSVGIYSSIVSGLATMDGIYDLEFRATDRLGRITPVTRCFDLSLRAPPLAYPDAMVVNGITYRPGASAAPGTTGSAPHKYALKMLSLGSPSGGLSDSLATQLLNDNASGAAILDRPFVNGTTSTIYLSVAVTAAKLGIKRDFVMDNWRTSSTPTSLACPAPPNQATGVCTPPSTVGEQYSWPAATVESEYTPTTYLVRVYEVDGNGAVATEVPCVTCTGPNFVFAIPPRQNDPIVPKPPRNFIAMTMLGTVELLRPSDSSHPANPPYADFTLNGSTRISGLKGMSSSGCLRRVQQVNGTYICTETGTIVPYRAVKNGSLSLITKLESDHSTSPSATGTARDTKNTKVDPTPNFWSTTETTLSTYP